MKSTRVSAVPASVVIVEDELIVAKDVQRILEQNGVRVAGWAATAAEAFEQIDRHRPDLVLLDVMLKGSPDGLEVARQLSASRPVPIVYLTACHDDETMQRASATNAVGYVMKPFHERQLCVTVKLALARAAASATPSRRLRLEQGMLAIAQIVEDLGFGNRPDAAWESRLTTCGLSRREAEIIRHIAVGGRVSSAAGLFELSPHTVRNHLKAAFRKLGVHSQAELVDWLRNH